MLWNMLRAVVGIGLMLFGTGLILGHFWAFATDGNYRSLMDAENANNWTLALIPLVVGFYIFPHQWRAPARISR